jgi:cell division protein FtsA
MSNSIIALDLGSTKIAVLIGRVEEDIEILGFSLVPSQGIKYGSIVDINSASNCIAEAVKKACRMSREKIEPKVIVGIGNDQVMTKQSRGMIIVKNKDLQINEQDVERVLEAAKATPIPPGKEIIYVMRREFLVDGQNNVDNPIGLAGTRLEVDVLLITYDITQLTNIRNALERADLEVEGFIPKEIASSSAVLSSEEKKLGVALADIGGDLTSLAVYKDGYILSIGTLRLGGEKITKDLAVGLKIKTEEAERAKKLIGSLKGDKEEYLDVISLQEKTIKISTSQVREIIRPRVEEILEFIEKKFKDLNYPLELIPGGLVVTGGTSLLDGFIEFASDYLKIPVRMGFPTELTKYIPKEDSYFYSVAMGILLRVREDRLNLKKDLPFFRILSIK